MHKVWSLSMQFCATKFRPKNAPKTQTKRPLQNSLSILQTFATKKPKPSNPHQNHHRPISSATKQPTVEPILRSLWSIPTPVDSGRKPQGLRGTAVGGELRWGDERRKVAVSSVDSSKDPNKCDSATAQLPTRGYKTPF